MISIIIPVYNAEAYIKKCLDSVCQQTYSDLEIIAVNDESSDGSLKILSEYEAADPRIRVISQKNQGVSAARNVGLEASKGEFIMFVDSDDWLDPDTCEKALTVQNEEHPDVVIWGYVCEYGSGVTTRKLPLGDSHVLLTGTEAFDFWRRLVGPLGKEMQQPHMIDTCATVWGKLYTRKCLNGIRFDPNFSAQEDILFNFLAFRSVSSISYIPEPLYHYRKDNAASITATYAFNTAESFQRLAMAIQRQLPAFQESSEFQQALRNRICCMLVGLGIRLVSDSSLKKSEKRSELKRILSLPFFHDPLQQLDYTPLPLHWRFFFGASSKKSTDAVYLLLRAMCWLKRHKSN